MTLPSRLLRFDNVDITKGNTIMPDFTREYAESLDQHDALASYRDEFYLRRTASIWMEIRSDFCQNERTNTDGVARGWKELGIDGWMTGRHPWFELSERLAALNAP